MTGYKHRLGTWKRRSYTSENDRRNATNFTKTSSKIAARLGGALRDCIITAGRRRGEAIRYGSLSVTTQHLDASGEHYYQDPPYMVCECGRGFVRRRMGLAVVSVNSIDVENGQKQIYLIKLGSKRGNGNLPNFLVKPRFGRIRTVAWKWPNRVLCKCKTKFRNSVFSASEILLSNG